MAYNPQPFQCALGIGEYLAGQSARVENLNLAIAHGRDPYMPDSAAYYNEVISGHIKNDKLYIIFCGAKCLCDSHMVVLGVDDSDSFSTVLESTISESQLEVLAS